MKEEFKYARGLWLDISSLVNALDELEMCKIRMEIDHSPEPNVPMHSNQRTANRPANFVRPSELQYQFNLHECDLKREKTELIRRLGQLLFLKNTFKVIENFQLN